MNWDSQVKNYCFLVTGSAGFIGFHVARALLSRQARVVGLDNYNDYYSPALKRDRDRELRKYPDFVSINGDLTDLALLQSLFATHSPQKVCHLAAQAGVRYSLVNPFAYQKANLEGFLNLIELAKQTQVERFVYASSSSVYAGLTEMPFSEAQRAPLQILGKTVSTLHPEDNLLMLCQHGTLDSWATLSAVSDVAHLIHSQNSWNWPRLLQRAKEARLRRQALLGLSLARELLGAPAPPEVMEEADADPSVVAVRRWVAQNLWVRNGEDLGFLKQTSFYLQTQDSFKDQVRHVWCRLAIPTSEDWRWISLPDSLIWVILRHPPLTPGVPRFNQAGLAPSKKINLAYCAPYNLPFTVQIESSS